MPLFPATPQPPLILGSDTLMAGSGTAVLAANTVYLYEIVVQVPVTVINMRWKMGSTATGTSDAGIYDSGGNLLGHTGATTNTASQNMNVAMIANVLLSPGKYFIALCPSNATDTYSRINLLGTTGSAIMPAYTATNSGTAGVLPATTGGTTLSGTCPVIAAAISGGI